MVGRDPSGVGRVTEARALVLGRIRHALANDAPEASAFTRDYRTRGPYSPGAAPLLDLLEDRIRDYRAGFLRATPESLTVQVGAALTQAVARSTGGAGPAGPGRLRLLVPPGLERRWVDGDLFDAELVVDGTTVDTVSLDTIDAVVTACALAIAETGTIVLDGSDDQGRRAATLVPDVHVCVAFAHQVVGTVSEAVARLDPRRPLTFISGPSATSDIELNRVEGVHGPRQLIVVLVS